MHLEARCKCGAGKGYAVGKVPRNDYYIQL